MSLNDLICDILKEAQQLHDSIDLNNLAYVSEKKRNMISHEGNGNIESL